LLVLVVLIGSLLAFGVGRPGREPQNPAIIPAVIGTPATRETVSGPAAEFLWEVSKTPDQHFINLGRPAVDPEGNLWVPDATHGQYFIFAPDGTYLETWGASGSGEGEFNLACADIPYGDVAFDGTGAFYVLDSGNARVQKFGPDRDFLTSFGSEGALDGQFLCPSAIAVDQQGRVYVSDRTWNEVTVFASDGTWLDTWSTPATPTGLAFGPDGNLWVATYGENSVVKFSPEGERLATWEESTSGDPLFDGPNNLTFDAEGRVFVTEHDGSRVKVFSPRGELLGAWGERGAGPGQFQEPRGVALDGEGQAYVTEWAGNRVQAFRLLPPLAPTTTASP
jgi:DNA-binding beta-propeller fold protein YncE